MGYASIQPPPRSPGIVTTVRATRLWQTLDGVNLDIPSDFDPRLSALRNHALVGLEIISPNPQSIIDLVKLGKLRLDGCAGVGVVEALAPIDSHTLGSLRSLSTRHRGQFALLVDRMDLAGCEYVVFKSAIERYRAAGIKPDVAIPAISASGEGICFAADRIDWYSGPTLQHWLGGLCAQTSS